jgi:hypothetical protein
MAANYFDIKAARKAGFNDEQIADELGKTINFDVSGARKAGIGEQEIISEITANPTYGMSTTDRTVAGVQQGLYSLARSSLKTSPAALVYEKLSGNEVLPSRAETDKPLLKTTAGQVGSILGGAAPFMAMPVGGFAGAAGSMVSKVAPKLGQWLGKSVIADATLGGAVQGAAQPDGDVLTNVKEGAMGGALGGAAVKAVGKLNRPITNMLGNAKQGVADKAQAMGYKLTPGQLTDSRLTQGVEAVSAGLPFIGPKMKRIANANQVNTNRRVLAEIGETADAATPEVMGAAEQRLGEQFTTLTAGKQIRLDKAFSDSLQAVKDQQGKLSDSLRNPKIESLINDWSKVPGQYPGKVSISSEVYQANRSVLTKEAKANYATNPQLAAAYEGLRDALDDVAGRSLPKEQQQAWQKARRQYGNMRMIEKALDPATGNIDPAKLGTILKRERPKEFIYGRGDNPLVDIGLYGQAFKPPIPNSGTAERLFALDLLKNPIGGVTSGAAGALAYPFQSLALAAPNKFAKGFINTPEWLRNNTARLLETVSAQKRINDQR